MIAPFGLMPRGAEVNVLKPHLKTTVATLLANGASQREIERRTGVDRKTIRSLLRTMGSVPRVEANSSTPATGRGGRCRAEAASAGALGL